MSYKKEEMKEVTPIGTPKTLISCEGQQKLMRRKKPRDKQKGDTYSEGVILPLNKLDQGATWRLGMLNEPFLKVFIDVFTNHCKFVL
jgi:hypothetical protein